MSAHGQAIGTSSPGRRAKDLAFRIAMLTCLGLAVLLLGVLIADVAVDGIGHVSIDFLTSDPSSTASKAGSSWPILASARAAGAASGVAPRRRSARAAWEGGGMVGSA